MAASMIEVLAWLVALPLSAMLVWFSAEVACGLRSMPAPPASATGDFVVVIPAHDEEAVIAATLEDLLGKVAHDRILVVADNCSDRTAIIARTMGIRVVERSDPARRGKGHALAFARQALLDAPPAAVMIFDADCRIARGDPALLAARAIETGIPIQAENLQLAPPGASPLAKVGAFASLVMNLVRARGLQRIGGGAFMQGTGSVIPWAVFARLRLASDDPVEDIDLTLQLARSGVPVLLDPRCRITSLSPVGSANLGQRKRWEHGSIRAVRRGLALMVNGAIRGSRLQAAVGAHYCVPPIALLTLTAAAAGVLFGIMALAGWTSAVPAAIVWIAMAAAVGAVAAAWAAAGRDTIDAATLLRIPAYVAGKLPIYLGLVRGDRPEWNRTDRTPPSGPDA